MFFNIHGVFILLASFRSRNSLIQLLASIQGAIVTESIIKCNFLTGSLIRKLIVIFIFLLIHYFGRYMTFVCPCRPFMFPFLSVTIPRYSVLQSKIGYNKWKKGNGISQASHITKMEYNEAKRQEERLIVASRLTIEDIFQCWYTPHFSISEKDCFINS